MKHFPVALQPYTIRDHLSKDFLGSLTRVAEIGYQSLELGPPPEGISLAEMKAHLDHLGLKTMGAHAGLEQLQHDLDSITDYLQEMHARYVTLSCRFESKAQVLEMAEVFNQIGQRCHERGVQFLYHNHDWEFVKFDGVYALDLLLEHTDPALVQMELDVYWVARGGENPQAFLAKLQDRCPVLHLKDMEAGDEQFFAEVGEGILDIPAILQVAEQVGVKHLVVEQDLSRRDPMDSIAISLQNLQQLGVVEG